MNWKETTCDLWVGSGLILAEKTFKLIKGYEQMKILILSLAATSFRGSKEGNDNYLQEKILKSIDTIMKKEILLD